MLYSLFNFFLIVYFRVFKIFLSIKVTDAPPFKYTCINLLLRVTRARIRKYIYPERAEMSLYKIGSIFYIINSLLLVLILS